MADSLRRMFVWFVLAAVVTYAGSVSTFAHHGGGVEYHMDQTLGPISGTVVRFNFAFPHPQIFFDLTNENGNVVRWAAVMRLSPVALRQRGWTRDSLKPGDTLSVTYSPHRTAPTVGFARRIEVNDEFLDEGM